MTDQPMAADDPCEHYYETRLLGGRPISVRACIFCRTPDWADLDEQAAELYLWGWQEGRDGQVARERLSAYDKPRQAQDGPRAPQDGPERPDAGAETVDGAGGRQAGADGRETLREQYAAVVECAIGLNVDCGGTEGVHRVRDAVLAVRDAELEQLREQLADGQHLYRLRTEQWRRAIEDRHRTEELCRQLAAALTGVLAEPRFPDSGGETAVYIGPVPCVRVERWRGVLKEHAYDGGPTVAEAAEQYDRP